MEPEPDEPRITSPQQKKLHAILRERFGNDRDAGLGAVSLILERDIESTKDLSKRDATDVIDRLEQPQESAEPALEEDDWPPTAEPPA
jgi:hypothetical protein